MLSTSLLEEEEEEEENENDCDCGDAHYYCWYYY